MRVRRIIVDTSLGYFYVLPTIAWHPHAKLLWIGWLKFLYGFEVLSNKTASSGEER